MKPSKGAILHLGKDIHEEKIYLRKWQSKITHVPQYIYLSNSNFESNIAFGIPSKQINNDRLIESAKLAHIHEFIKSTDNGYKTIVGERGVKISGGQRQRLGIARALYKDANLLILDEATSALDNYTEKNVMDEIKKMAQSMTIIIIAHRLTTIQKCDRIVVFEKGKINGIGSYEQLEQKNSIFSKLVRSARQHGE